MKVVIYGSVLYQSALTAYPGAWNEFSINPFVNPLHFGTAFWMITIQRIFFQLFGFELINVQLAFFH
jgi:hypothetical protein